MKGISGRTGHFNVLYGVETIGIEAFAGCKRLSSITIPESVSEIRMLAFAHTNEILCVFEKNFGLMRRLPLTGFEG